MNGMLATTWLMFSSSPLQRWLRRAGYAALLGGVAGLRAGPVSWWPPVLLISGVFLTLAIPVFISGLLLRQLACPRNIQLAPGARLRLLLGTLLTLLLAAGGMALATCLLLLHATHPPAGITVPGMTVMIFVAGFSLSTLCCLGFYYCCRTRFGFLVPILLTGNLRWLLALFPQLQPARLAADPAWLTGLAGGTLGLWLLFGLLFLRARRIAPASPATWGGGWNTGQDLGVASLRWPAPARDGAPPTDMPFTRPLALRTVLTGLAPGGRLGNYRMLLRALLINGGLLAFIVLMSADRRHPPTSFPATLLSFMGTAIMFAMVASVIRRSRYLWLKSGLGRRQLFLAIETFCWRLLLAIGAGVMLLAGLFGVFTHAPLLMLAQAGLLTLVPCTAVLYLGLACIRGWRLAPDFLLGVFYSLVWLATFVVSLGPELSPRLLGLLGLQAILGLLFRFWARARWDGIDWLRNKPLPTPALPR